LEFVLTIVNNLSNIMLCLHSMPYRDICLSWASPAPNTPAKRPYILYLLKATCFTAHETDENINVVLADE